MNDELKEAKGKLDSLLKERAEIVKKIEEAESLKPRLKELEGGWNSYGEIKTAELKARDLSFPVFEKTKWRTLRVIGIDDKWISVRYDGGGDEFKYKKSNGWRERSRDGRDIIDVQKAIEIWEKHQILKGEPN